MKFKMMLAMLAAVGTLSACEELLGEDDMGPDGSKPSVTINRPTANQSVTASQGLPIAVTIIDKDELPQVHFYVAGAAGEKPLVDFTKSSAKTVIEFDTVVAIPGVKPGNYTLKVTATDKRTNTTEKNVNFVVR